MQSSSSKIASTETAWSPLCFQPLFRPYLWGGRRLQSHLAKPIPADGIWAESWEIVDHGEDQSVVTDGPFQGRTLGSLLQEYPVEMLGSGAQSASHTSSPNSSSRPITFPLLLKYLDCQQVLSVQVHPEDNYAQRMTPPDLGKTEAWYVVHAEPESVIYAGLKHGVTREEMQRAIESGTTQNTLHEIKPQAGDCVFIPAGTVHALGGGLIVAEIQQSSDTTFRLFDWNRVDAQGKGRPLHIQQALEVIDFDRGPVAIQKPKPIATGAETGMEELVVCDKFSLLRVSQPGRFALCPAAETEAANSGGKFTIVTVPRGQAIVRWGAGSRELSTGMSVLIPAVMTGVFLQVDDPATNVLIARPTAESCRS